MQDRTVKEDPAAREGLHHEPINTAPVFNSTIAVMPVAWPEAPEAWSLAVAAQMEPRALYRAAQHPSARTWQRMQWAAARHDDDRYITNENYPGKVFDKVERCWIDKKRLEPQPNKARTETGNGKAERAQVPALRPDAEVGPVMELFDEILSAALSPEPPMRDVEGFPVEIQCRETAGLHELTPAEVNDEEEDEKSRLPPPTNLLLTRHDAESLEILIGDHIEFIRCIG